MMLNTEMVEVLKKAIKEHNESRKAIEQPSQPPILGKNDARKKQTAMMVLLDKWHRMPPYVFQKWMKENHSKILENEKKQLVEAADRNYACQDQFMINGIEYYDEIFRMLIRDAANISIDVTTKTVSVSVERKKD